MSWVRIWVHLIFSTKNWEPFLTDKIRDKVFHHIKENAKEKGILLIRVNGGVDHCHCLLSLSKEHSISKVAQLIKGESSFWINKNALVKDFMWQDDYYAVSVDDGRVKSLKDYIDNQTEHHRKKTFKEEYDGFIKEYS
jgi:REP element-mobilizing transposase RayT